MTFAHKNMDKSQTIKRIYPKDGLIIVEYLDGYCDERRYLSENEQKLLFSDMLKQAKERDKCYYNSNTFDSFSYMKAKELCGLISTIVSWNVAFINALNQNNVFLKEFSLLFAVTGAITLAYAQKIHRERKELRKYHQYLEIMKNNPEFLTKPEIQEEIYFDIYYQEPFEINSLDKYSSRKVNKIYKKFKNS